MAAKLGVLVLRLCIVAALALLSGIRPGLAATNLSAVRVFDIPAQPLPSALLKFSTQSGVQVTSSAEMLEGKQSPGVIGKFTPQAALTKLLRGTNLRYDVIDATTIAIRGQSSGAASVEPPAPTDPGAAAQNSTAGPRAEPQLKEVIVTAQKKRQRLIDTPVPETVVDSQRLTQTEQLRLQDFYTQVPGLSLTTGALSSEFISIRGIGNELARESQTVGIVVDDAPFGTNLSVQPTDVDPGDIAQIEVLRGPQGTLYGASSMGGLIKYDLIEPSTTGVTAQIQAGTSSVYNGAEPGYNTRGAVNMPLSDNLALRLSAYSREEPGYIDDVETKQQGVNVQHARGGHLAALWRPAGDWSVLLNAFYTDTVSEGVNESDLPTVGYPQTANLQNLQQYRAWGSGYSNTQAQFYSAKIDGKLGGINLESITTYNAIRLKATGDYSTYFSAFAQQLFNVSGAIAPQLDPTASFTQEFRLSASPWRSLDWVAGAFLTHQYSSDHDSIQPEDPLTGAWSDGNLFYESFPQDYQEDAAFADLTFHLTDKFNVQVGGRESHIYESYSYYSIGDLNGGPTATYIEPKIGTGVNAFTYLFTPTYNIGPNSMIYLRLASGFRAGTLNPTATGVAFGQVPLAADPDKTYDYDLGVKSDFLDRRLSVDASLYYIDWQRIQLLVTEVVAGLTNSFTTNAGAAKSDGVELSVTAKPLPGLTASGWIDYDDAVLKDGFPATSSFVGNPGDWLPYTSRYSGHISLREAFPLWGDSTGFVGASADYVGNRLGDFQTAGVAREHYPAYTKADLQAGVMLGQWTINAYANNVTNRQGIISAGLDDAPPVSAVSYIVPRLIGLNVIWTR